MKSPVVHLLTGAEAAGDDQRVDGWRVLEAVIRQDGEAGLRLDGSCRVRDQAGIEFGIEPASDGEHAVRRREIDDLGVLEDVDAEAESSNVRHGSTVRSSRSGLGLRARRAPAVTNGKSIRFERRD